MMGWGPVASTLKDMPVQTQHAWSYPYILTVWIPNQKKKKEKNKIKMKTI